jgi:hypothetical protein
MVILNILRKIIVIKCVQEKNVIYVYYTKQMLFMRSIYILSSRGDEPYLVQLLNFSF